MPVSASRRLGESRILSFTTPDTDNDNDNDNDSDSDSDNDKTIFNPEVAIFSHACLVVKYDDKL